MLLLLLPLVGAQYPGNNAGGQSFGAGQFGQQGYPQPQYPQQPYSPQYGQGQTQYGQQFGRQYGQNPSSFFLPGSFLGGGAGLGSPCDARQRAQNPRRCFDFMRTAAEDNNRYWYGSKLEEQCGSNRNSRNASCTNALPQGAAPFSYQSLGSRLFVDPNFQASTYLNGLNHTLDVTYTSNGEWVWGCNSSMYSGGSYTFDANPGMEPVSAFYTKNAPFIRLEQLCTLVFYDASVGYIHNIFTNWPRDNPFFTEPAYQGPGNARVEPNTYVWLVFQQQSNNLTVPPNLQTLSSYSINLRELAQRDNLTGPVAMTWLPVKGDIYSAEVFNGLFSGEGTARTCPALLEQQLLKDRQVISYQLGIEVYPNMLNYFLPVQMKDNFTWPHKEMWADSMQNGLVPINYLQQRPILSLFPRLTLVRFPNDLQGKIFTFLLLSPSGYGPIVTGNSAVNTNLAPQAGSNLPNNRRKRQITPGRGPIIGGPGTFPTPGPRTNASFEETGALQFVFWMAFDVPGLQLDGGIHPVGYANIRQLPVLKTPSSQLYLLAVEQNRLIGNVDRWLSRDCGPYTVLDKRCNFSLGKYLSDNQWRVDALARFQTDNNMQIRMNGLTVLFGGKKKH